MRHVLFDAYGTLFDVHSAIAREGAALGEKAASISALWRTKQLEYTWVLSAMGASKGYDFAKLTARSLDFALESHGIRNDILRQRLLNAYDRLDAYPDVAPTLQRLKQAGAKTAIFTNGTPEMVENAILAAALGPLIDQVITVGPCDVFKPRPAVYAHALSACGALNAKAVTFVSSNRWDVAGAAHFGFTPLWINRSGAPEEYPEHPPAHVLRSLSEIEI